MFICSSKEIPEGLIVLDFNTKILDIAPFFSYVCALSKIVRVLYVQYMKLFFVHYRENCILVLLLFEFRNII